MEEIKAVERTIQSLKEGWGATCETKDTDDYPELRGHEDKRCGSCRAKEIIAFLEEHAEFLREEQEEAKPNAALRPNLPE